MGVGAPFVHEVQGRGGVLDGCGIALGVEEGELRVGDVAGDGEDGVFGGIETGHLLWGTIFSFE